MVKKLFISVLLATSAATLFAENFEQDQYYLVPESPGVMVSAVYSPELLEGKPLPFLEPLEKVENLIRYYCVGPSHYCWGRVDCY